MKTGEFASCYSIARAQTDRCNFGRRMKGRRITFSPNKNRGTPGSSYLTIGLSSELIEASRLKKGDCVDLRVDWKNRRGAILRQDRPSGWTLSRGRNKNGRWASGTFGMKARPGMPFVRETARVEAQVTSEMIVFSLPEEMFRFSENGQIKL